jgi:hypothetical protein
MLSIALVVMYLHPLSVGAGSVLSRRSVEASRSHQAEVGHFLDPGDVPPIHYSPGASCTIKILKLDEIGQHEVVDSLDGNFVKQRFNVWKPRRIGIRSNTVDLS